MTDKTLIAAADNLIRELNLPQNKGVDLSELLDNSFERVSGQMLSDLLALEATVKGRNKALVPVAANKATTAPVKTRAKPKAKAKGKSRKSIRVQTDHEKDVALALSDMDSVIDYAEEIGYGKVTSAAGSLPKNQFKTGGLVNQIWKKRVGSGLNSGPIRESLVKTLLRTLGAMENINKAERHGFSRATRWVILK